MRKKARRIAGLALAFLTVAATTAAQQDLTLHPGYFAIDELAVFDGDAVEVEIDVAGPMMKMIAGASEESDPDFARLVGGLERIRVRVGNVSGLEALSDRLDEAAERLLGDGWSQVVRVRDQQDRVYVYTRELDGQIQGLTVLAGDETEVALINIVGAFDIESLGRLFAGMEIEGLDGVFDGN